jgi:hypothetical protein
VTDDTRTIGDELRDIFAGYTGKPVERSEVEIDRKRRMDVALWAYAYEYENVSLVTDFEYDREAALIRPEMDTGHAVLDEFFRTEFAPHTGMWVRSHPERHKLAALYRRRTAPTR